MPSSTSAAAASTSGRAVVRDTHDYGVLSFTDVIVKSSNIGAIRIGFKLGTDRLSDYVQKFGFGRPVSPDFPSESPGIVWERTKWTDSALASVSMGYQVGVTPLQMVTAVSSVANGGSYIEPRVVRAIYRDGRRLVVRPKVVRQTVSKDTAASMTGIMEQVVDARNCDAGEDPRVHHRRQDGHREQAGQRSVLERHLRLICRLPSVE